MVYNLYKGNFFENRTLIHLEVGQLYLVQHFKVKNKVCKFIQVTPKGYNFLDIEENKCVFYPHFYYYKQTKKFLVLKTILLSKFVESSTKEK